MTGHKSLREVERYVAAASQLKLADAAMASVNQEQNLANPGDRLAKTAGK